MNLIVKSLMLIPAFMIAAVVPSSAAVSLEELTRSSAAILTAKQGSADPIPDADLKAARGVAILDVSKGGFIIGGTGGSGVVVVKNKKGLGGMFGMESWSAPIPVTISGGSFGAQIGGSNTKAIILLNSEQAVNVFTHPGKLGWDAQASGTAGTDSQAEMTGGLLSDKDIKIYKNTAGLFGGATFGGTTLSISEDLIQQSYGSGIYVRDILEGKVKVPAYAETLVNTLDGKR